MLLELTKSDITLLIRSIISYELSRQRGSYFPLFFDFEARGAFAKAPFECDSFALVSLAVAVGDYFGVKESGLEENFIRYADFESWVAIVDDSLKHYNKGINFQTSGTTGEPQRVFHSFEALSREATFLAHLFDGAREIHSFVRMHHIYGFLYAIALPKYLKRPLFVHEPLPTNLFFKLPSESLLISTPTLYEQVLKLEGSFSSQIVAVSSTEPLTQEISLKLQERGIAKVVEIYGSSQSMGVGYRENGAATFTLFDYLQKERLHNLQDELLWRDERHFEVLKRLDSMVKHRGYLVDLVELQERLCALDGVLKCEVVFTKGEIVAFVTPKERALAMIGIAKLQSPKPDTLIWMDTCQNS